MPSYTTYPTDRDLQEFLVGSGFIGNPPLTPEALLDLQNALDSTRQDWEDRTGWKPFLKDAADVTRYYDPPGHPQRGGSWISSRGGQRKLFLGAGLLSCTSVTVGLDRSNPTGSPGTVLTLYSDYRLAPTDAAYTSQPYEYIEFMSAQWGATESIAIAGRWGRVTEVPPSVWRSHLFGGTLWLMPSIYALTAGGVGISEIKLGDNTYSFNGKLEEVNMLRAQYEKTLSNYTRVRL